MGFHAQPAFQGDTEKLFNSVPVTCFFVIKVTVCSLYRACGGAGGVRCAELENRGKLSGLQRKLRLCSVCK